MNKLLENLANLVKVKTIVTLVVITVFAVMTLSGAISADNVMIIISMVVSFYFGTQHEKSSVPTASTPQPPTELLGTVTDTDNSITEPAVDDATYNKTHPDIAA